MKKIATSLAFLTLAAAPAWADDVQPDADSLGVFEVQALPEGDLSWYQGYASTVSETRENFVVAAPIESENFGLNWSSSGRWGLTLDLTRRSENMVLPEEELDAGAFFQVTPRLRLGGGIRLRGDAVTDSKRWAEDEEREADVRIESAFSF